MVETLRKMMVSQLLSQLLPVIVLGVVFSACSDTTQPQPDARPAMAAPSELSDAERLFNSNCAGCHGIGAVGTDRGPSFLSKIYEPSHHGDDAFRLAARNGVRAHHWTFGNMPKISGVSPAEIDRIISYVRWIQRENGIS
ncbi:MAG: c-type cytochrome [Nitrospiria bacterium]